MTHQFFCLNSTTDSTTNDSEPICEYEERVQHTELRTNESYVLWYLNVANKLITMVIPFVSLIFLNFNIFLSLKQHVAKSQQRRQSREEYVILNTVYLERERRIERKERNMVQQTLMLFVIVILFLISHTPRIVLNLEEWIYMKNAEDARKINCTWLQYWTLFLTPLSHLLLQINSITSSFLYCILNSLYKEILRGKLYRGTESTVELLRSIRL